MNDLKTLYDACSDKDELAQIAEKLGIERGGLPQILESIVGLIPENVPETIIVNGTYETEGGVNVLKVGPIYEDLIENAKRGGCSLVKYIEPEIDAEVVVQVITSITKNGSLWAYAIDVDPTSDVMSIIKIIEE